MSIFTETEFNFSHQSKIKMAKSQSMIMILNRTKKKALIKSGMKLKKIYF
jgi:hypothetical protein